MPKRPCAIALSYNESAIICADKFGDVYSLPLLISHGSIGQDCSTIPSNSRHSTPLALESFRPAANVLTVHSARNRKALQNQSRQEHKETEKTEVHFEQKLLLGHVSMLTDVALVEYDGRNYIVTADRDEHIRISRGIPQTHIIEGYCLGHTEFVSCLCAPATYPDLLISGGGEDEIYVWNWLEGKIVQKVNLRSQISKYILEANQDLDAAEVIGITGGRFCLPSNIAVSNIKHMAKGPNMQSDHIIVACEG
jgi:tRNA (guanine-N(7)-)-methyltransferase subunit TRM82